MKRENKKIRNILVFVRFYCYIFDVNKIIKNIKYKSFLEGGRNGI